DGRRFSPDDFRATGTKPAVAAIGQLVGTTVERAVAPFHGLHKESIADGQFPDTDRLKQWGHVGRKGQLMAQPRRLRDDVLRRLEFEESGHPRIVAISLRGMRYLRSLAVSAWSEKLPWRAQPPY